MENLVERFLTALFEERDIHAALELCSEDICCYSSVVGYVCEGKDDMLIMMVKLLDAVPGETIYRFTDIKEIMLSTDNVAVYVEYDLYKPDAKDWMQGRASVIKSYREGTWRIQYIHSTTYSAQLNHTDQVFEECFFNQATGFFGTDISYWYYDIANKRIIHNSHSVEIHGFSNIIENVPESLIESRYVHPDSAADFRAMYERLASGENRVTGDFWIKPNHMDKYWCERIIYTTIYSINNKPMIAMGISKDVTSEKIWSINMDAVYANLPDATDLEGPQEISLREDMELQIRKAIEEKEFEIFLQPKVNSHENKVCGAEALIRWRHPKQGLLPPGEFIPKLEGLNLMHLLDEYAFQCVCEYQQERIKRSLPLYPISSNLSLHSLSNADVINGIERLLQSVDIPKEYLILEVTETAFVSDTKLILSHIRRLQSMGIKISMDDFGCGTSSFSQLANMPVDELKLDMRLVQNAASSIRGNAILLSILKLAEWLKLPVVAEGMETEEQVKYLQNADCFICQGYYYSRPLPLKEYERYEEQLG